MSHSFSEQDIERILPNLARLIESALAHTREDATLAPEFRCPYDGSSRTFKISAAIASRPRARAVCGDKIITLDVGNPAVDALVSGPEPQRMDIQFFGGLGVVLLGGLSALLFHLGCAGLLVMGLGLLGAGRALFLDHDFEARHQTWEKRSAEAETHWWCEACHETFLPERRIPLDQDISQASANLSRCQHEDAGNIEPLRPPR